MLQKRSYKSFKVSRESLSESRPVKRERGPFSQSDLFSQSDSTLHAPTQEQQQDSTLIVSNWITETMDFPLFACTDATLDASIDEIHQGQGEREEPYQQKRFPNYLHPIPAGCYYYSMSCYHAGQIHNICHLLDILSLPLGPTRIRECVLYQLNYDSRPTQCYLNQRFHYYFQMDKIRNLYLQPIRPVQLHFHQTMAVDVHTIGACQVDFLNQLGLALDLLDTQGATSIKCYLRYLLYLPRQGVSLLEPPHPYPPVGYQVPLQAFPPAIYY